MTRLPLMPMLAVGLIALLGGCATRPINPPITQADSHTGYRYEVRQSRSKDTGKETMVILAFSGGGTRAPRFPMESWNFSANEDRRLQGKDRSAAG